MSVLTDWEIRELIEAGEIKVDPFDSSLINPVSLDVRLGDTFTWVEPTNTTISGFNGGPLDPLDRSSFKNVTKKLPQGIELESLGFVLASLFEDIELPDSVCAKVVGKSSLGRLGLGNSGQAGLVDAGWSGILTVELFNYSDYSIKLTPGMKIGQLMFYRTERVEKGYQKTGRYSKQAAGQGSLGV